MTTRILIAGVSTRAAADSAARAGYHVTAIDAFGDLDQHPSVKALSLPRDFGVPFGAAAAARAGGALECDAVAYLSSFENHPAAVAALARGRRLYGNPPAVLRRVRHPRQLADALGRLGVAVPAVWCDDSLRISPPDDSMSWLVKPRASGGGRRIRRWHRGMPVPRDGYLQAFVDGAPGSIVFVAARGRAVPIGLTRQLIGDAAFGASRFQYCGNILVASGDAAFGHDEAIASAAERLARLVAAEFELLGVNGIDFMARDGVPYPIEVNPRWPASAELVERAYGLSGFGLHAAACATGSLPRFDLTAARGRQGAMGKAIVFARSDVTVRQADLWLDSAGISDVPHPGERIRARQPVCTVYATAADADSCHAALVRRARDVYAHLADADGCRGEPRLGTDRRVGAASER